MASVLPKEHHHAREVVLRAGLEGIASLLVVCCVTAAYFSATGVCETTHSFFVLVRALAIQSRRETALKPLIWWFSS